MGPHRFVWGPPGLAVFAWLLGSPVPPVCRAADNPAFPPRLSWLDHTLRAFPPQGFDPLHWYSQLGETGTRLRPPEFVEYLYWQATGKGTGWFHPGETRYGWKWLAARHGVGAEGRITRQAFKGPVAFFDRLDRNRDGVLTAADFAWPVEVPSQTQGRADPTSPDQAPGSKPMAKEEPEFNVRPIRPGPGADRDAMLKRLQETMSNHLFKTVDANGDGKVTREEWLALFEKAAQGKDHLTPEDLLRALVRKQQRKEPVRALGLFKGETGSFFEGPGVDQVGPDFTLRTQDGKREVRLSQFRGHKPVVLIFANYT